MKTARQIKSIIINKKVSDSEVREEIEKLGTETLTVFESKEVLGLLKEKRPQFYKEWQLEVATSYM